MLRKWNCNRFATGDSNRIESNRLHVSHHFIITLCSRTTSPFIWISIKYINYRQYFFMSKVRQRKTARTNMKEKENKSAAINNSPWVVVRPFSIDLAFQFAFFLDFVSKYCEHGNLISLKRFNEPKKKHVKPIWQTIRFTGLYMDTTALSQTGDMTFCR